MREERGEYLVMSRALLSNKVRSLSIDHRTCGRQPTIFDIFNEKWTYTVTIIGDTSAETRRCREKEVLGLHTVRTCAYVFIVRC
jgi:hypothetical protein